MPTTNPPEMKRESASESKMAEGPFLFPPEGQKVDDSVLAWAKKVGRASIRVPGSNPTSPEPDVPPTSPN